MRIKRRNGRRKAEGDTMDGMTMMMKVLVVIMFLACIFFGFLGK